MNHYNEQREQHRQEPEWPQPEDWPDGERIENIFHNGGEALHYPKEGNKDDLLP